MYKSNGNIFDFSVEGADYGGIGNNTYLVTYYQTSGNPWAIAGYYPSYTVALVGSNKFTLKNNIDIYALMTNNYHVVTAQSILPTLANGQCIRFVDLYGYLGTTQLVVNQNGTNTIEMTSSVTLSTNSLSRLYAYLGNGSYGSCIRL